jgi:hypothetical protein
VESWASAGKLGVLAEVVRRRARPGHEHARRGDMPSAWEEDAGHQVALTLAASVPAADKLIALAVDLAARLPGTYAALAAGRIDYVKASIIARELSVLDDVLAGAAEALILPHLDGKTPGQVGKLAAAAAVTVDPAGAEKRREQAEREDARVRFWREHTGACALAGYGLPTDAALAATANIAARAGAVAATVLSDADNAAIDADRTELAELKAMWDTREITTSEYRQMRKTVEDRIRKIEAKTLIRPAVEVLEGMTGPGARATWDALEEAGNYERLNAVLRFLFAAIRIGESQAPSGRFDYGRIDIEQNKL